MPGWTQVLELDADRSPIAGDTTALANAIRAGADLRIGTAFRHNEHIDPSSERDELIREVMDFRVAYLVEDRWVAGIENLRMPVELPDGFGPRESMSFFLYNQDGHQAIARPYLDDRPATGQPGPSVVNDWPEMPKYHELAAFDSATNAPSSNFIYDFEYFQYFVSGGWREVFSHEADGTVTAGDVNELADAVAGGAEVKVAIAGLCADLEEGPATVEHEVFLHLGACYYYTQQQQLMAAAHPVVRTRPTIPLGYGTAGWDFGWLMPRTDGHVAGWLCDPLTLRFRRDDRRHAIRWFVSE
ncbi:MAG: hypothetical protein CMJ65_06210 [Planctomycetaceae bacterium]|nr:hypothetical protein [Planctomycetaceae bacterium]